MLRKSIHIPTDKFRTKAQKYMTQETKIAIFQKIRIKTISSMECFKHVRKKGCAVCFAFAHHTKQTHTNNTQKDLTLKKKTGNEKSCPKLL